MAKDQSVKQKTGNRSVRLTRLAWLLFSIAVALVVLGMLAPAFSKSKCPAHRIWCASNLKQIGLALKQYAIDNKDCFPPKNGAAGFEYLARGKYIDDPKMFICPEKKTKPAIRGEPLTEATVDYVYRSGLSESDSPDSALAWEKPDNHKKYGNILFLDGHVTGYPGTKWFGNAQ